MCCVCFVLVQCDVNQSIHFFVTRFLQSAQIHGVGGGTGQWACQMAKAQGYRVIGTVSKGKAEAVKALDACEELIVLDEVKGAKFEDYTSVDVVGRVMEVTKGVGGERWERNITMTTRNIYEPLLK